MSCCGARLAHRRRRRNSRRGMGDPRRSRRGYGSAGGREHREAGSEDLDTQSARGPRYFRRRHGLRSCRGDRQSIFAAAPRGCSRRPTQQSRGKGLIPDHQGRRLWVCGCTKRNAERSSMIYGITMGDSSGVGPEILLKAFRNGELQRPVVAFGDVDALDYYNDRLGYGVPLRAVVRVAEGQPDALKVIDHGRMRRGDITPGQLNRKSGQAAREYVVSATRSTLAGEIAAIVTLPMNKEATQMSDPSFVGHTEL